jgi:hypothetical protein
MGEQSVGLKSLHDRLTNLEQSAQQPTSSFFNKIVTLTTQEQNQTKSQQMDAIKQHFDTGLTANLKDTSMNMFSYVVEYTVTYVENNIGKITQVIGVGINSSTKLNIALSFLTDYFDGLDKQFLINSVNHMVELLFNRNKSTPSIAMKTSKNLKGSISKASKIFLPKK